MKTIIIAVVLGLLTQVVTAQTTSFTQFKETHPELSKRALKKAYKAYEKREVELYVASIKPEQIIVSTEPKEKTVAGKILRTVGITALYAGVVSVLLWGSGLVGE